MTDNPQRAHYESIHEEYAAAYYDDVGLRYRRRFVFPRMWGGLDLDGKNVADLACGSGYNSLELRRTYPNVVTTGFDISPPAVEHYKELVGGEAYEADLTRPMDASYGPFDAAIVFGGMHHCVLDLRQTYENIAAMLKPGGWLLMCEPNARYVLEPMRKLWYAVDPYFEAGSEHALDHDEMLASVADLFEGDSVEYVGGPAWYVLANSMIMRVPTAMKPALEPAMTGAEQLFERIPFKQAYSGFIARWRKRG